MTDIDVSKIPADVMDAAMKVAVEMEVHAAIGTTTRAKAEHIAIAILQERADCAQHAFRMRWAPVDGMGTSDAEIISRITTDWSQKIGMAILNRSDA